MIPLITFDDFRDAPPCLHFPSKFEWFPLWILPKFSLIPLFGSQKRLIPAFVLLQIRWTPQIPPGGKWWSDPKIAEVMLKSAGVFREASSFAPWEGLQDSLGLSSSRCGFRIPGIGLGIPCQWSLNSRFLVLNIPDSTRKDFQDSGFYKQKLPRFQNPGYLTCYESSLSHPSFDCDDEMLLFLIKSKFERIRSNFFIIWIQNTAQKCCSF